jgi:hypothetical protein
MNGSTFWQYGKKILQNIQDRITIEMLKRIDDPVKRGTKLPESLSTEENEKRTEDTNTVDIDSFDPAEDSNYDVLQPYDQMRLRSHESLIDHGHINNTTLVEASMTSESLFDIPVEGYAQENSSATKKGGPRRRPTKLEAAAINGILRNIV